ncbi:hypothetical protein VCRA2127O450_140053 [Vibrio crassostreae]|nr:hypothetical protein VCRA2113O411_140053 [Vibrio crassostreae]CAK2293842.1 hypothetical protein VCRA2113O410_150050 [Vibrio crassostreae]CAK2552418.1 hypothetical protein VCRA2113O419_130050 [Vibrio crassostreae]CAK3151619.1 hypothetical protein VCRA2127O450_140053 [Vibrio crassostreae]
MLFELFKQLVTSASALYRHKSSKKQAVSTRGALLVVYH